MFRIWSTARASLTVSYTGYSSQGLVSNNKLAFAKAAVFFGSRLGHNRVALQRTAHIHNRPQSRYTLQEQQDRQLQEKQEWQHHNQDPGNERVPLLNPTLWAFAFSAGVFYICSNAFVEHMEEIGNKSTILGSIRSILLGDVDSDQRVWELMNDVQVQALVGRSHRVNGIAHAKKIRFIARLPHWVPFELKRTAISFADQWYHLSQSKRCVYTLVGINAVVFGMWHIPRLLPLMARSFLHDPRSGRAYTMLTSTFSHKDFLHFAFNNIALVSFGTTVAGAMGSEQFIAFYLSAGVLSSLASQVFAPLLPALMLPSLGASGAIYGVVGATMILYPNIQTGLIFLPFVPFSISTLFPALMACDLVGIVRGWRSFNHVAHFVGGLYGIAYVWWGKEVWICFVQFAEARRVK